MGTSALLRQPDKMLKDKLQWTRITPRGVAILVYSWYKIKKTNSEGKAALGPNWPTLPELIPVSLA